MSKYYLNIHYRSIAATQDAAGASAASSPGHIYVSFKCNGSDEEYFGLYKPDGLIPAGLGKVETENEKEMHLRVKQLSEEMNKNVIFTKQIELTQEQYNTAVKYARKRSSEDNLYLLGFQDCVEFTQSVYNAAGLPLYFSHVYSSEELSQLPNLAATKIKSVYGPRDAKSNVLIVEGLSRENVASRLNLPVDRVELIPKAPTSHVAAEDFLKLDTFRISLHDSDFLPKTLVKTINPPIQINETEDTEIPSTSQVNPQTFSMDDDELNLIKLLSSLGLLEVNNKLDRLNMLKRKVIDLLKDLEVKANDVVRDLIDFKNKVLTDKEKGCNSEKAMKKQQIESDCQAYNDRIFAEKQAELKAETNIKLAEVKAAAGPNGSYTFSNADIAARKQSEYNSLLDQYKAQCENAIESLMSKENSQLEGFARSEENDLKSKVNMMKSEVKKVSEDVLSQLQDAEEKVIRGEDVNFDAVMHSVETKVSAHLVGLKQIAGNTAVVNAVFEVLYDNPVLNYPKLMATVAQKFGIGAVNELIGLGKNLGNMNILEDFSEQSEDIYYNLCKENCHHPRSSLTGQTLLETGACLLTRVNIKDLQCGKEGHDEDALTQCCIVCKAHLQAILNMWETQKGPINFKNL